MYYATQRVETHRLRTTDLACQKTGLEAGPQEPDLLGSALYLRVSCILGVSWPVS